MMSLQFFTILKVCTDMIKNSNYSLLKISRSHDIAYLSKWQKGLEQVYWSKLLEQIYRATSIMKCDFNNIALQLYYNHTSAWAFCKFLHIFWIPFYKNIPEGVIPMMTSQTLRSMDSPKIQIFEHLERKNIFSSNKKIPS